MQDDVVIVHEPVDVLLTCVRQVLLLAKPRDKQLPDSIVGMVDGGTTPSVLRPGLGASQESNPNQVNPLPLPLHPCSPCKSCEQLGTATQVL